MIKNKILLGFVLIDFVLLNITLIYLGYRVIVAGGSRVETKVTNNECGIECKKYIDEKLSQQLNMVNTQLRVSLRPSETPRPTLKPTTVLPQKKVRSVSYMAIPGSGSTLNNDWTSVSGSDFYFDISDYPGLKEVYFEVNIKLLNGNGAAFVRLYDATHGIAISESVLTTSSQTTSNLSSSLLNFWSGRNLIRIQVKSLTADTAVFESGRLRIVTEN
ncbi:hypothetical protein A2627_03625 [Candidatus Woesebacteria bacterium RIFCSPHIGHO2_01_FULL_39_28]|uniref:Uncharacterized protein n=1 Tax=Candidatus Woesebacteria bacterium RIFCSPHIGHO2_01_FULL_39_28 TaxID=1802496 RepID=A0A1F7YFI9_9BACT|nr:MAG: hypothetical protein A2627_03625 [Candidatus Woesebacteria bacterium RIFCSPHIGHO2_01_FULL_39_28]